MLALLALIGTVAAAPQYYNYYQQGYPVMPVYPQYPLYQQYPIYQTVPADLAVDGRAGFFTLPNFQRAKADFVLDSAAGRTMSGNVQFKQNILTGDGMQYKAYLKGDDVKGNKFQLGVASSCTATASNLGNQITAPKVGNGFYLKASTSDFNINGNGGKTSVVGMVITVTNEAGTVVGCTGTIATI